MTVLAPRRPAGGRRRALVARVLALPALAVVLLAGLWVAGGVLTNDFRASVALTTAWFALAGAACLAIAVRRRAWRVPVLVMYLLVAGGVGGYLAFTTLHDRVVHERVVTGTPMRDLHAAGAPASRRSAPVNVELACGTFRSGEHATMGRAAVVRLPDDRRYLTLTSLQTSAGPDLRVRLVRGDTTDGAVAGAVDLGALKGNRGDQQYRLPRDAAIAERTVVIWCRAFSAPFGSARLTAA